MAAITYTANARAPLITDSPAHTAGTDYSIDVKLKTLTEAIETPKSVHTSIGGNTETVLQRATRVINIMLIWPNSENADIEEFLFSVAGGESFVFDAYGTTGSPDDPIYVASINEGFTIGRMQQYGSTPWRSVSLVLRPSV